MLNLIFQQFLSEKMLENSETSLKQQPSPDSFSQSKPKKLIRTPIKLNIPSRKFIPKQSLQLQSKSSSEPSTEDSDKKQSPLLIHAKFGQHHSFFDKYELKEKIGEGASGIVYKCVKKDGSGTYAVKQTRCEDQHFLMMKNVYDTIKMLNHPSIIKYKSIYITGNFRQAFLIMQWFDYPELCKVKFKSEEELQNVVYKILDAIAYMHEIGICHRDIKPANILYNQSSEQIKIIDFGVSKQIKTGKLKRQMLTCTGTLYYKAPELFRSGFYDQLIDQWAAGITIYKLITGYTPFESQYVQQTIENIERGHLQFNEPVWNDYSSLVKDLIRSLVAPRENRITARIARNNLWFSGHQNHYQSMHRQIYKQQENKQQNAHFMRCRKNSIQVSKNVMIRSLKNTDLMINKNGICHESDYQISDEDQKNDIKKEEKE